MLTEWPRFVAFPACEYGDTVYLFDVIGKTLFNINSFGEDVEFEQYNTHSFL